MKRIIFYVFICVIFAKNISADDFKSMNAVQLNTKGFKLYSEQKFEKSLEYFKASFTKDSGYVYPHYNYACVLSILEKEESIDDITYHVLTSMRLLSKYKTKWLTDPDLKWYRNIMSKRTDYQALENIMNYDLNIHSSEVTDFLISENDWYILHQHGIGAIYIRLRFDYNGIIEADYFEDSMDSSTNKHLSEKGEYKIIGNIVYIKFKPPFKINDLGHPKYDTIDELYVLYYNNTVYTIYCPNFRLGLNTNPDTGY